MSVQSYAKAIAAGVLAGLGTAGTAIIDDGITPAEWITIAAAVIGTAYGVWQTPNARQNTFEDGARALGAPPPTRLRRDPGDD